ncbi:MAG: hypothetical protein KDA78_20785 [Planctomycetaceae bacterium]|nr:hypothetical protein [Planctomycetaceae bacterium]
MPEYDAANSLIDAWLAYRDMAAQLLVTHLNLESPKQILRPALRGKHELIGTGWCYRTHGIGVDVFRKNGRGGIDFDFSAIPGRLFAYPDWWRLCIFMRRIIHDKTVDISPFAAIIANPEDYEDLVISVLEMRRQESQCG